MGIIHFFFFNGVLLVPSVDIHNQTEGQGDFVQMYHLTLREVKIPK